MGRANGYVLYRGPSLYTGAPIVVVATGIKSGSTNVKTGAAIQTHIMPAGESPADAIRGGRDSDVCLGCIHNTATGRGSCYVHPIILRGWGTAGTWEAWRRGAYPVADTARALHAIGRGRYVRLGTWGDPAAVPVWVWAALVSGAARHTGYTHAGGGNFERFEALRPFCMASVETESEAARAQSLGWRTYRVIPFGAERGRTRVEAQCPASAEAGKRRTCATCPATLVCSGASGAPVSRGIAIQAHGATRKRL